MKWHLPGKTWPGNPRAKADQDNRYTWCITRQAVDGGWSEGEEGAKHSSVVRRGGVCWDVWGAQQGMVTTQCCWWKFVEASPKKKF